MRTHSSPLSGHSCRMTKCHYAHSLIHSNQVHSSCTQWNANKGKGFPNSQFHWNRSHRAVPGWVAVCDAIVSSGSLPYLANYSKGSLESIMNLPKSRSPVISGWPLSSINLHPCLLGNRASMYGWSLFIDSIIRNEANAVSYAALLLISKMSCWILRYLLILNL